MTSAPPSPATLGELRDSGYTARTVKEEIRDNLLTRLRSGETAFPGIVGFDDTVAARAGARPAGRPRPRPARRARPGQDPADAHARSACSTSGAPWSPAARSTTTRTRPVCVRCRRLAAELGDDLPITWRHRDDRYTEKLATPDTSVGDLIGDVDPVKVAQGRTLGDPETVHYGLVPRTNRGIFGLNELPDLAERIQVALFNVLEERDIQVRGYSLRLPLDVLLVATANPEDYTNRGRIITPLKDRFGAEIRTHYLAEVADEVALIAQEAELVAEVPEHLLEVLARFTRALRESPSVDQRSGVSARFAIAAAEAVAASALRRGGPRRRRRRRSPGSATCRRCCRPCSARSSSRWARRAARSEVLDHLLRLAVAETFRARLAGLDLSGFTDLFAEGAVVETGDARAGERAARPGRQRFPGCPRCSTGSATATTRPPARSPPPSSSSSRDCT